MCIWTVQKLRLSSMILGISNTVVLLVGTLLVILSYPSCDRQYLFPFVAVLVAAAVRLGAMLQSGIAQEAAAKTILESTAVADASAAIVDSVIRHGRRV